MNDFHSLNVLFFCCIEEELKTFKSQPLTICLTFQITVEFNENAATQIFIFRHSIFGVKHYKSCLCNACDVIRYNLINDLNPTNFLAMILYIYA